MANNLFNLLLFRICLPTSIAFCVIFRPCLFSGIYLLILLYLPFVPLPTPTNMPAHTSIFLKIVIVITTLINAVHITFQIVLSVGRSYFNKLDRNSNIILITRHVGLLWYKGLSAGTTFRWIGPDCMMFIIAVGTLILAKKINRFEREMQEEELEEGEKSHQNVGYLKHSMTLGQLCVLTFLCTAGILRPSALGFTYYITFLGAVTWWACYKPLRKGFAVYMCLVLAKIAVHLMVLFIFQMKWPQSLLPINNFFERIFGITRLYVYSHEEEMDWRSFEWNIHEEWVSFLNPIILYLLYYSSVLTVKVIFEQTKLPPKPVSLPHLSSEKPQEGDVVKNRWKAAAGKAKQNLIAESRKLKKDGTIKEQTSQDVKPKIKFNKENEYINDNRLPHSHIKHGNVLNNVMEVFEVLLRLIVRSSYIVTNIIMMIWSITYLSWLTFVLAMWANFMWLLPKQRQKMLRTSPLLVLYASFLLISAYFYSLNFTDEELPQSPFLNEIGFVKYRHFPCVPLLIKTLYTVFFWITLRQFMQERTEKRQARVLANMVAPLEVIPDVVHEKYQPEYELIEKIGTVTKIFLTRLWLWIVVSSLLIASISGDRVTGFGNLYMGLFLSFVMFYQCFYGIWKKLLLPFWILLISLMMTIFTCIYTYQFRNFPDYWTKYLNISPKLQYDLGLEQYAIKELFIKLVSPTYFVIITVTQLHFFHKNYMYLTDPKNFKDYSGGEDMDERNKNLQIISVKVLKVFYRSINVVFLILEIHMKKYVLLIGALLCVYDLCAINFVVILILSFSQVCGLKMRSFAIYITSLASCFMIAMRIVNQMQFSTMDDAVVKCHFNNTWKNDITWLGFHKDKKPSESLMVLIDWNVIYLVNATLWSMLMKRQYAYKVSKGKPTNVVSLMFPGITRHDADKSVANCLKFLANYGFHKFGLEISLITIVILIAIRLDLIALIHAVWLCIFLLLRRKTVSRLWIFYQVFIVVSIPFQYLMCIGYPPSFCQDYFWDNTTKTWQDLQTWAYLVSNKYPPDTKKLVCDYILLIVALRQWIAFRDERIYYGKTYDGGSNEKVIHHAEEEDFIIPIPDFITYTKSYLDIIKQCMLTSFLWINLMVMFLVGTRGTTIFSLGYLLFSFMFMWNGSEIYLYPIPKILRGWQVLICYNAAIILMKTCFQLWGCVYIQTVPINHCWIFQFLGVSCERVDDYRFGEYHEGDHCPLPTDIEGILWEAVCFGCLIFQRRIFNSYYFFHIINDTKATTILASRGAELMKELSLRTMNKTEEEDMTIKERINMKMEKIKASQLKIEGATMLQATSHAVAIRSGDYYMFDEIEEAEVVILPDEKEDVSDDDSDLEDVAELLSNMMKGERNLSRSGSSIRWSRPESLQSTQSIEDNQVQNMEIEESSESSIESSAGSQALSEDEFIEQTQLTKNFAIKMVEFFVFLWAFIDSFIMTLTKILNRYSRNYRYILKVMSNEKRTLKESTNYNIGVRLGKNAVWQPAASYRVLLKQSKYKKKLKKSLESKKSDKEMSTRGQPNIARLLVAIWYTIMSRSEYICYFAIFLNQIKTATVLSLPLPLMVFFWGAMTIPRPSKTFWITIIAYTEIVVMLKCIFQFELLPINTIRSKTEYIFSSQESLELHPVSVFGLHKQRNYAIWDLVLLMAVFFHRILLKRMGLWASSFAKAAALLEDAEYQLEGLELRKIKNDAEEPSTSSGKKTKITFKDTKSSRDNVYIFRTKQVIPITKIFTVIQMTLLKYVETFKNFNTQLLAPSAHVAHDVYTKMFLCDLANFFVILFGYTSFGASDDDSMNSYLEQNRVPPIFLAMLITQFFIILVDRAIYLRKNLFVKLIFQYAQVIGVHVWLFALFPVQTGRFCNTVMAPQVFYIIKCFYLLLSAFQIRCGYPTRIFGNFLCKRYGLMNMILFRGFILIPFLYELRTCLDWMWSDTSLSVFDWIKMEDIFRHIFLIKCVRQWETEFPHPRGTMRKRSLKYLLGGTIVLCLIFFIWFPLIFFSFKNVVEHPNPPFQVDVEFRIGTYEPIYEISVSGDSMIFSFNDKDFLDLQSIYNGHQLSEKFLYYYKPSDVAVVTFSTDSSNSWIISPPERKKIIEEIASEKPLKLFFQYVVSHKTTKAEDSGLIRDGVSTEITDMNIKSGLFKMLTKQSSEPVLIPYIFPKFLKVTNEGTATPVKDLMLEYPEENAKSLRNLTLKLEYFEDKEWWTLHETCTDKNHKQFLEGIPYEDCTDALVFYTFNDKTFPPTLDLVTGGGIIGMYALYFFMVYEVVSDLFEQVDDVWLDDMPMVDRINRLCREIYCCREMRNFDMEEMLYAKLLFLMRSREMAVRMTREDIDYDPEVFL